MNDQLVMFDGLANALGFRRVETPAARATDVSSSHEAAEQITASGVRQKHVDAVIRAVRAHPGLTSAELAPLCKLDRVETARRTSDAETAGAIRKGEMKRQPHNNRPAVTWWPTRESNG